MKTPSELGPELGVLSPALGWCFSPFVFSSGPFFFSLNRWTCCVCWLTSVRWVWEHDGCAGIVLSALTGHTQIGRRTKVCSAHHRLKTHLHKSVHNRLFRQSSDGPSPPEGGRGRTLPWLRHCPVPVLNGHLTRECLRHGDCERQA